MAVRIIGVLSLIYGLINLIDQILKRESLSVLTFACDGLFNILLIISGILLIMLRQFGFELTFMILRLFIIIGILATIMGLVSWQPIAIIFGIIFLIPVIGVHILLSRNREKINSEIQTNKQSN